MIIQYNIINKNWFITKLHLVISVLIVVPAAFIYAFQSEAVLGLFPKTINEFNVYKAIMGLYLGCSIIWVLGILRSPMLYTALVTNMMFMLGLGLGRVLSIVLDGTPSFVYVFGTFAELFLGLYGAWVILKFKHPQ